MTVRLAADLRLAIKATGRSTNSIAKRSGVPQQVLQRFISGSRNNLRLDTIDKLMRCLGLQVLPERDDLAVKADLVTLDELDKSVALIEVWRSQISIAIAGRGFLEENLSGSPKAEAHARAVVQ